MMKNRIVSSLNNYMRTRRSDARQSQGPSMLLGIGAILAFALVPPSARADTVVSNYNVICNGSSHLDGKGRQVDRVGIQAAFDAAPNQGTIRFTSGHVCVVDQAIE